MVTPRSSLRGLPPPTTSDNELRRRLLLVTRLLAFDLAPGRRGRPAARALPLATAQRMVHRVHRHPAHARHPPEPAALAGFAHRQQLVLGVPDLANRREAFPAHHPHLGGPEAQRDVAPFLRHDLHTSYRRAARAAALTDLPPQR